MQISQKSRAIKELIGEGKLHMANIRCCRVLLLPLKSTARPLADRQELAVYEAERGGVVSSFIVFAAGHLF